MSRLFREWRSSRESWTAASQLDRPFHQAASDRKPINVEFAIMYFMLWVGLTCFKACNVTVTESGVFLRLTIISLTSAEVQIGLGRSNSWGFF